MTYFINMLLCLKDTQFNKNNLLINNKINNNVINNSFFYRIYYSTKNAILNGISMEFVFNNITVEKHFNKIKINFNKKDNFNTISKLVKIENDLMNILDIDKKKKFLLRDQLENNYIKIINNDNRNANSLKLILKISGFWETNHDFGLTFRFLNIC